MSASSSSSSFTVWLEDIPEVKATIKPQLLKPKVLGKQMQQVEAQQQQQQQQPMRHFSQAELESALPLRSGGVQKKR